MRQIVFCPLIAALTITNRGSIHKVHTNATYDCSEILINECTTSGLDANFPDLKSGYADHVNAKESLWSSVTYIDTASHTACMDTKSESAPIRVAIDNNFNEDTQCGAIEDMGNPETLAHNFDNPGSPGTYLAYEEIMPTTCTATDKCPLIVNIRGAGGDAKFVKQAGLPSCLDTLHSAVIAPWAAQDAWLGPLVESYVANNSDVIDTNRIYVMAQSHGNEQGIRFALDRPDLISMVSASGTFGLEDATITAIKEYQHSEDHKLSSIQIYLGDGDGQHDEDLFENMDAFENFPSDKVDVYLRIFKGIGHITTWSNWNALHEWVWTGTKDMSEWKSTSNPLSC